MDLKLLEESKDKKQAYFHLKGADIATANALRRTIVNDLPSMAIDAVTFFENTSVMFNEYVANRIGLIPLTWEDDLDPKTEITFTLNIEAISDPIMVYSKDLKSSDEKIKVFEENLPIMKLVKGQKLRLEATARMGVPRVHAKFQSCHASYNFFPEIVVGNCKNKKEVLETIPAGVVDKEFKVLQPHKVRLEWPLDEASEPEGSIKIVPKEGEFILFIESYNNLTAKEQLKRALTLLQNKVDDLEKEVKKL